MRKLKAPKDPRGGHVRIYWEIVESYAWRALSWADQGLYVALRRKLLGSNNGNIEATLASLRPAGITSSASLAKGLRALMAMGLLAKTRQGGIAHGIKVCCLYRFTDEEVFEHPKHGVRAGRATNEWKRFKSSSEAVAELKAAHLAALRPVRNGDEQLQELNRLDSEIEASIDISDSFPEEVPFPLVQFLNKTGRPQNPSHAA